MPKRILVIDDDPDVRRILKTVLVRAGYKATVAAYGEEGLEKAHEYCPDLILLDIMLPDMDGWQVCRCLREEINVPIIMLTVLRRERDLVEGLKLGADDYIFKPWSNRELLARVQAVLRRAETSPTRTWQRNCWCGDVTIDLRHREVNIDGSKIHVTPLEFRLLTYLARRSGRVVPYGELIAQIWGAECTPDIMRLRWHVHNLRQKIEKDPTQPQYLLGKRGIGYYCAG